LNDLLDKVEGELEAERKLREENSQKLEKKLHSEIYKYQEVLVMEKKVREET
jgi:hypothetical protein